MWYSCGGDWLRWCLAEEFGWKTNVHEIQLDMQHVYTIRNEEEFDQFVDKYGMSYLGRNNKLFPRENPESKKLYEELDRSQPRWGEKIYPPYIDWEKVQADGYFGMEISPYLWSRRLDGGMWYYGWDCASGVIWDKRAFIDSQLIAYEENGKLKYSNGRENQTTAS
jgi:hypothetical protein